MVVVVMNSAEEDYVLVFDCGSTNLKAVAVDSTGNICAYANRRNSSHPQPGGESGWLIWDLDEIWRKLCETSREVLGRVGPENIKAVTVITWGADGAPIKRDGSLTYPPISWQCPRTRSVAEAITERISPWEIFRITGYQIIPFNTLFKLIWLRRNKPEALKNAYTWLMMPGLIANRLTGEFHIDPTTASTMMAMDLGKRDWSITMLELADLDESFFPEWKEPGEIVGYVSEEAGRKSSLIPGTPVVAGGHDTQFAIFGSGAKSGETVLSSGTWEILGVRADAFNPTKKGFEEGLIIEADVEKDFWNPQFLMIASAVVEWVLNNFFQDITNKRYETIIKEIESIPYGSNEILFIPSFVKDSGPLRKYGSLGAIFGLTLNSSRFQIIRAVYEGLTFQTREALRLLTESLSIKIDRLRVVGGGSRNDLWNQMRADIIGLPIIVPEQRETASLGAALISLVGIDYYDSVKEARKNFFTKEKIFEPNIAANIIYNEVFKKFMNFLKCIKEFLE